MFAFTEVKGGRVGAGKTDATPENDAMNQRRRYKTPPIEEAICEFRFLPGGREWDLTIPGKLQTALGDQYTGKPRTQKVVEIGLETQEGKPPNLKYGEGLARVQLLTTNGKRMVGVGADVMSVHILRPYQNAPTPQESGWQEFQPRISAALDAYWQVAEPVGVSRVGIRYVNRIVIPQDTINIDDYLKCALPLVTGLPERLTNFVSRVAYAYADGVQLILSQGSIKGTPGSMSFLLDLDVIWEGTGSTASRAKALDVVDDLRKREREAFEAVITDKTRDLFDADAD